MYIFINFIFKKLVLFFLKKLLSNDIVYYILSKQLNVFFFLKYLHVTHF